MKNICTRRLIAKLSAIFAIAVISGSTTAYAQSTEYIIFELKSEDASVVEKFALGSVLKDGDKINLPKDATLKLLDKSGEVVVLTGPLVGTVLNEDGDSQKAKDGSNALQVIAKLMFGEENLVNNLGAARAIEAVKDGTEKIQPWSPVVSIAGTYCLPFDAPVFARANARKDAKVTLISGDEVFKEKAWKKNEKTISVADMIVPEKDKYTLFVSSLTTESSLHLLDRSKMNITQQIAWMAEKGCKTQAIQLLHEAAEKAE